MDTQLLDRLRTSYAGITRDAAATRRAFENYAAVGALAGIALPGRIPPRAGSSRLGARRLGFRARDGLVLETELANTWPIIEVFRDLQYDVPLDWSGARTVVDVGGHVGAFAIWAAARAPRARIVVFEPEPRNARDLRLNLERNGLSKRVEVVEAAVAAHHGRRALNVPEQRNTASFARGDQESSTTLVDCVVLQDHLREQGMHEIDVLKLDCEGEEWEILPRLLEDGGLHVRDLLVECHGDSKDDAERMRETLAAHGFATQLLASGEGAAPFPVIATIWGSRT